jgi:hypothetical protein
MREYQVRICERLGVKFPGPTRHNSNPSSALACQLSPAADIPTHSLWVWRQGGTIGAARRSIGAAVTVAAGKLLAEVDHAKRR